MKRKIVLCAFALMLGLRLIACTKPDYGNPYRTLMASLDWGKDTCYVYGHKTPDADAACSSLGYAQLMRSLGYNCVAKVSSPTNNETRYISGVFGFEMPELKSYVAPGTRIIATDHEEYSQSVDGARDARLLQIVDHHQAGDMAKEDVPFIRREVIGATCSMVWELFQEADVSLDDNTARILLAGILSDTDNLAKANTTHEDSVAWLALTSQLGLSADSVARIRAGMIDALTDYSAMNDYEIFVSDYKDYDMTGNAVGIGCVEWIDYASMDGFLKRMQEVMPEVMSRKGRTMLFLMATNYAPGPAGKIVEDGMYILYGGEGAREVAEKAFGPSVREGMCFVGRRLGRKTDVVPVFTEILAH